MIHVRNGVGRGLSRVMILTTFLLAACESTPLSSKLGEARTFGLNWLDAGQRLFVVCFDGTWNTPQSDTNVHQFYEIARRRAESAPVIPYYVEGVGTSFAMTKKGGKTGKGVKGRVAEAYRLVSEYWRPGDELVVVGFSRGAYQARLFAGLLGTVGIHYRGGLARAKGDPRFPALRSMANSRQVEALCAGFLDADSQDEIERRLKGSESWRRPDDADPTDPWFFPSVACLVCFDTVAAVADLGAATRQEYPPIPEFQRRVFDNTELALHAMALDENRRVFELVPFAPAPAARLKQVWFAGAHSDIGGGYEHSGQNHITLTWALQELPAGIKNALGLPEAPCALPRLHDPMSETALPMDPGTRAAVPNACIHPSVAKRMEMGDYRPLVDWFAPR